MSVRTAAPRPLADVPHQSTDALVQGLFNRISHISTLPEVALRIFEVANDPASGAEDLREVIEHDAALAARIMRTVNSSYYARRKRIADLKRAITLLGFDEIRNLALSTYVADLFRRTTGHGRYSRRGLWTHLVGVAILARLIAQTTRKAPPQEAYLAGLLHDLGLILIDQYLHSPFCRVVEAITEKTPVCEVERGILGFDHARLGGFVAAKWQLPDHLAAAVRCHHSQDEYEGPHHELIAVVALANIFCHLKNRTSLGVRNAQMPSARLLGRLELEEQDVLRIWEQADPALEAADSLADAHVGLK